MKRLSPEEVKAVADGAEARASGSTTAQQFVDDALTEGELTAEINKLAALPLSVYESKRVAEANRLSMRVGVLDKLVAAARPKDEAKLQGAAIELVARAPATEAVDGSDLLANIIAQISRFIFITEHEKIATALWVIGSYAFDAFFIFPRLRLKSATKGCGKSTLLDLLECLVNKPLIPSDITGPSLFRIIAAQRPTMLLDEADRYMKADNNLAAAVNAGHKKNGSSIRCVGDGQDVRAFSVWAPMAIASIGTLQGTVEDRSIPLNLQRMPPTEKLERFRGDRPPAELVVIASQAARWAADNEMALGDADPAMPAEKKLSNRAADNWRPLLAVADLIGGEWPEKARKALAALQNSTADDDAVRLLFDLNEEFTAEAMHSVDVVDVLVKREGSPWPEYGKNGKPLSTARLAAMLREFNIHASQIKINGVNRNGYRRSQFEPLFRAYEAEFAAMTASPPIQDSTASTALKNQEELAFQDSTSEKEGRVLEGTFSEENQRGRPGRVSYRGAKANGHVGRSLADTEAVESERGPLSDFDAVKAEAAEQGVMVANGYAISHSSEDRKPGPTARVWIREIRHPAISAGPDDDLNDFAPL